MRRHLNTAADRFPVTATPDPARLDMPAMRDRTTVKKP